MDLRSSVPSMMFQDQYCTFDYIACILSERKNKPVSLDELVNTIPREPYELINRRNARHHLLSTIAVINMTYIYKNLKKGSNVPYGKDPIMVDCSSGVKKYSFNRTFLEWYESIAKE